MPLPRGQRAIVQATMMGSVAVVITSTLLLLWFLDNPYHHGARGLRPTAMERTLALLKLETGIAGGRFAIPATGKEWRAVAEPARCWADSQPPSAGRSSRRMTS
jgi:hypothetical protein